jgi:hypothetical protein
MMKKRISAVAIMSFLSMAFISWAADPLPPIPPLPKHFEGIKIVKLDPSLPKEIADFIGEWQGAMVVRLRAGDLPREVRRAKVIVYQVTKDKVFFLYGVGDNPYTKSPASWREIEADIIEQGGRKRFTFMTSYGYSGEQAKMDFFLEDGILYGTVKSASIEMKRVI